MARTTSARGDVKKQLAQLITDRAGTGVDVHLADPQDKTRNYIIIGDVTGQIDFAWLMAGRKRRKDVFTVTIWCIAQTPGMTDEQAEDAVLGLFGYLEDIFADDPTIGLEGVKWAGKGTADGPLTDSMAAEGYRSVIRFTVEFNCEYS